MGIGSYLHKYHCDTHWNVLSCYLELKGLTTGLKYDQNFRNDVEVVCTPLHFHILKFETLFVHGLRLHAYTVIEHPHA